MITGTINDFAPDLSKEAEALKADIALFFNIEVPDRTLPQIYLGDADTFFIQNEGLFISVTNNEMRQEKEAWQAVLADLNLNLPIEGALSVRQRELLDYCRKEIISVGGLYLNSNTTTEPVDTWEERIFISESSKAKPGHILTHELIHFLSSDGRGSTGFKTPDSAKNRNIFNEACTSLLTLCYEIKSTSISDLREHLKKVTSGEITVGYPVQTAQLLLILQRLELNGVSNPVGELVSAYFGQDEKDINYYMFLMKMKANIQTTDEKSIKIIKDCCLSLGLQ